MAAEVEVHDDFASYPAGSDGGPAWEPLAGSWAMSDGLYEQTDPDLYRAVTYLREPVVADFAVTVWFKVLPTGTHRVMAPGIVVRSTSAGREYWAHFDALNGQVLLQRQLTSQPGTESDIKRAPVSLTPGEWHEGRVECRGNRLTVSLDGRVVLEVEDQTYLSGKVGLCAGQGNVQFDDFRLLGTRGILPDEWKAASMSFKHQVICRDAGAGGYEAFPDLVRLQNGDLLCVFYAGYTHVSHPNEALPGGARVSAVRSTDGGKTWGEAQVVADTPWDDRDPSICQLRDGTLVANWFTYYEGSPTRREGNPNPYKEIWLSRSTDDGHTWSEPELIPSTASDHYGCSTPIRVMPDGTLVMAIYKELPNPLRVWSLMIHSPDGGKTWGEPVFVDPDNDDNDEPDIIMLPDGRLLCVMRSNRGDNVMWFSESTDGGQTWSPSAPIGFPGHAPYLLRTREGILLCAHRLPGTSLHYSLNDGKTWSENVPVDEVIGAYPSMVQMPDGRVLIVYYEEGDGSSIRARFFTAKTDGIELEE